MMGHTHWVIGAASWLGILALAPETFSHSPAVLFGGTAIAAVIALAPDIDTKGSMASKALGPVTGALSWLIRSLFGGHRKITHSILGWVLIVAGAFALSKFAHFPLWVEAALAAGWASHILSDMLTREGCPLLWPLSESKMGIHAVESGGPAEKYFIRPMAIAACIGFSIMIVVL